MSLDKAHAQLAKIGSDPTIANRPQGLILLNPIPAGRIQPVAVCTAHCRIFESTDLVNLGFPVPIT